MKKVAQLVYAKASRATEKQSGKYVLKKQQTASWQVAKWSILEPGEAARWLYTTGETHCTSKSHER